MTKLNWTPSARRELDNLKPQEHVDLDEMKVKDLPPAMVNYFAKRMVRVSKHAGGRRGRKVRGKDARRRALRARGEGVAERSAWAQRLEAERAAGVIYEEHKLIQPEDVERQMAEYSNRAPGLGVSTSNEDES